MLSLEPADYWKRKKMLFRIPVAFGFVCKHRSIISGGDLFIGDITNWLGNIVAFWFMFGTNSRALCCVRCICVEAFQPGVAWRNAFFSLMS